MSPSISTTAARAAARSRALLGQHGSQAHGRCQQQPGRPWALHASPDRSCFVTGCAGGIDRPQLKIPDLLNKAMPVTDGSSTLDSFPTSCTLEGVALCPFFPGLFSHSGTSSLWVKSFLKGHSGTLCQWHN